MINNSNMISNNFKQILDRRSTITLRSGPLLTGAEKNILNTKTELTVGAY